MVHTVEAISRLRKPAGATMDGAKTEITVAFADFMQDHPMAKAMAPEFMFVYLKGCLEDSMLKNSLNKELL